MITVTPLAAEKIQQQLKNRGRGLGIRIAVRTTGCSGLSYVLEYVDQLQLGDDAILFEGYSIIINAKDKVYLEGLEIDYQRRGLNQGFEFNNPNEKARCGCGESFTV